MNLFETMYGMWTNQSSPGLTSGLAERANNPVNLQADVEIAASVMEVRR